MTDFEVCVSCKRRIDVDTAKRAIVKSALRSGVPKCSCGAVIQISEMLDRLVSALIPAPAPAPAPAPILSSGRCTTCQQIVKKLNPHIFDSKKLRVLDDIGRLNAAGHGLIRPEQDGPKLLVPDGLDGYQFIQNSIPNCREHAQRLSYFGLLKIVGERKASGFCITPLGIAFLAGKVDAPATIWCRQGEKVEESEVRVTASSVGGVVLDAAYWDAYPAFTKRAGT